MHGIIETLTHFDKILSDLQDNLGRLLKSEYDILGKEYYDYPFTVKHNYRIGLDALEQVKDDSLPIIFYGNGSSYLNDRIQRPTGFVGETLENTC